MIMNATSIGRELGPCFDLYCLQQESLIVHIPSPVTFLPLIDEPQHLQPLH